MNRETERWYDFILEFFSRFDEGYFVGCLMICLFTLIVGGFITSWVSPSTPDTPEEIRVKEFNRCMNNEIHADRATCERLVWGIKP